MFVGSKFYRKLTKSVYGCFREDSGSKDNEIVATSARENCCNQKIDSLTEMAVVGSLGRIPKILLMEILLVQV